MKTKKVNPINNNRINQNEGKRILTIASASTSIAAMYGSLKLKTKNSHALNSEVEKKNIT